MDNIYRIIKQTYDNNQLKFKKQKDSQIFLNIKNPSCEFNIRISIKFLSRRR